MDHSSEASGVPGATSALHSFYNLQPKQARQQFSPAKSLSLTDRPHAGVKVHYCLINPFLFSVVPHAVCIVALQRATGEISIMVPKNKQEVLAINYMTRLSCPGIQTRMCTAVCPISYDHLFISNALSCCYKV